MSDFLTIDELLTKGIRLLEVSTVAHPRIDAELLLIHVLSCSKLEIYTHPDDIVPDQAVSEYLKAVSMRIEGGPVQYITGTTDFYNVSLKVNPDVLIPRPETEVLVSTILDEVRTNRLSAPGGALNLLEVGTGSGAISVALARELNHQVDLAIVATDISNRALTVARDNTLKYGFEELIEFRCGDMFDVVANGEMFHIITANPPYVSSSDLEMLPAEVKDREPLVALLAGETGYEFIDILIRESRKHLHPGGLLALEIGMGQNERATTMLEEYGYERSYCRNDLSGIPRVATAWYRPLV